MSLKIKSEVFFPKYVKNSEFKRFITQMLQKNLLQRLYKLNRIKIHPFFESFNWNGLINFELDTPYLPKYKDFSNARLCAMVSLTQADLTEWKQDKYAKISEAQKKKNNVWFEAF